MSDYNIYSDRRRNRSKRAYVEMFKDTIILLIVAAGAILTSAGKTPTN